MSKRVKNPTKLQSVLSVAAFVSGVIIGSVSLFVIPPPGEISNSALGLVSELLLMSSALLGVNVAFDYKLAKFKTDVRKNFENNNMEYDSDDQEDPEE